MSDKKLSYKRKSKLLEQALAENDIKMARLTGLLGVMIYIFGEDVMSAVTAFNDDPTEDNKDKIREMLNLRFMETQQEEESS